MRGPIPYNIMYTQWFYCIKLPNLLVFLIIIIAIVIVIIIVIIIVIKKKFYLWEDPGLSYRIFIWAFSTSLVSPSPIITERDSLVNKIYNGSSKEKKKNGRWAFQNVIWKNSSSLSIYIIYLQNITLICHSLILSSTSFVS